MAKKIMLIIKNDSTRKTMRELLSRKGYDIVGEAALGKDAFFLLDHAVSPNLAIITYDLSDTDGLSLARQILQVRPSLSIVLYVNIEGSSKEILEQARAIGIRCVLRSRYSPEILWDAVESALQRSLFSTPAFRSFGSDSPVSSPAFTPQQRLAVLLKDLEPNLPKASPANRILIADSAPFMQMMISQELAKRGYVIIGKTANDEDCLRMFSEQKPDLVTVSYEPPESGFGGFSLIQKIRNQDPSASVLLRISSDKYPDIAAKKDTLFKDDSGALSGVICTPFAQNKLLMEVDQLLRYRLDRPWFGCDTDPAVKQAWPRVAIFEKSPLKLGVILLFLATYGYQAAGVALNVPECERLCQEEQPDLIIGGYETIQEETDCMEWIRRIRQPENAPRLILCIDPDKTPNSALLAQKGIQSGASLCMPFSLPKNYTRTDPAGMLFRCIMDICQRTDLNMIRSIDACLRY